MRELRRALPPERRREAEKKAQSQLKLLCQDKESILSYIPFDGELDITPLNEMWAQEGRLVVSCITGKSLSLYRITDLSSQLTSHRWGFVEPNSNFCSLFLPEKISIALIPGVGFTEHFHRLGYGKGYYDRFLHQLHIQTIGIGFREQLISSFPHEEHDIPLSQILLF